MEAFRQIGFEVFGVDISDSSPADEHIRMDLADSSCGEQLMDVVGERGVDGLINNASIGLDKSAVDTVSEEFDRVMAEIGRAHV